MPPPGSNSTNKNSTAVDGIEVAAFPVGLKPTTESTDQKKVRKLQHPTHPLVSYASLRPVLIILTISALILMVKLLCTNFSSWNGSLDLSEVSVVITGFFFVVGRVLGWTLQNLREAEKVPLRIANTLDYVEDWLIIINAKVASKGCSIAEARKILLALADSSLALVRGEYEVYTNVVHQLQMLETVVKHWDKNGCSDGDSTTVAIESIRQVLYRCYVLSKTREIPSIVGLVDHFALATIVCLFVSRYRTSAGVTLIHLSIVTVVVGLVVLIHMLTNPFRVFRVGRSSVTEVDLFPLTEYCERLRTFVKEDEKTPSTEKFVVYTGEASLQPPSSFQYPMHPALKHTRYKYVVFAIFVSGILLGGKLLLRYYAKWNGIVNIAEFNMIMTGLFFVIGAMFSASFKDFQEAERSPSELVNTLQLVECLFNIALNKVSSPDCRISQIRASLLTLTESVLQQVGGDETAFVRCDRQIRILHAFVLRWQKNKAACIRHIPLHLATIRRLLTRNRVIARTNSVPLLQSVLWFFVFSTCVILFITIFPSDAALCLVLLSLYTVLFLLSFFIYAMDDPFAPKNFFQMGSVGQVDLFPVTEYCEYLRRQVEADKASAVSLAEPPDITLPNSEDWQEHETNTAKVRWVSVGIAFVVAWACVGVRLILWYQASFRGYMQVSEVAVMVTGLFFVTTQVMGTTFSDYGESERIPCDLATALDAVERGFTLAQSHIGDKAPNDAKKMRTILLAASRSALDQFRGQDEAHIQFLHQLRLLTKLAREWERKGTEIVLSRNIPRYLDAARRCVVRAKVISDTSALPVVQTLLHFFMLATTVCLFLTSFAHVGSLIVTLITLYTVLWLLSYLLVKMDDPFSSTNGRFTNVARVDLFPMTEFIDQLQRRVANDGGPQEDISDLSIPLLFHSCKLPQARLFPVLVALFCALAILGLKLILRYFGSFNGYFPMSDVSFILTSFFFIAGQSFTSTNASYRESEKIPADVALALENVEDCFMMSSARIMRDGVLIPRYNPATDHDEAPTLYTMAHVSAVMSFLSETCLEVLKGSLSEYGNVLHQLRVLSQIAAAWDRRGCPCVVQIPRAVDPLRIVMSRAIVLSRTTDLPVAQALLRFFSLGVCVVLFLVSFTSVASLCMVLLSLYTIFLLMPFLVREMDDPFDGGVIPFVGSLCAVDLSPLSRYCKRIAHHSSTLSTTFSMHHQRSLEDQEPDDQTKPPLVPERSDLAARDHHRPPAANLPAVMFHLASLLCPPTLSKKAAGCVDRRVPALACSMLPTLTDPRWVDRLTAASADYPLCNARLDTAELRSLDLTLNEGDPQRHPTHEDIEFAQYKPVILFIFLAAVGAAIKIMLRYTADFNGAMSASDVGIIISCLFFLSGQRMSLIVSDFREAEKLPMSIANTVEYVQDLTMVAQTKVAQHFHCRETRKIASELLVDVIAQFRGQTDQYSVCLQHLRDLVEMIQGWSAKGASGTSSSPPALDRIRQGIGRGRVISITSVLPVSQGLFLFFIMSTTIAIFVTSFPSVGALCAVLMTLYTVMWLLSFLLWEMDDPFHPGVLPHIGTVGTVDLFPLTEVSEKFQNWCEEDELLVKLREELSDKHSMFSGYSEATNQEI